MALSELCNLASERLGASVLAASDEFFAGREHLVRDAEAVFDPDAYVPTGKLMDGWETRRRRTPGHDHCLIRLGLRGVISEIVVDTAFFRGNFPAECAIEACDVAGTPSVAELDGEATIWRELVPRSALAGDAKNPFAVRDPGPVSHLRLRIYPDGGVARLRVHGRPLADWDALDAGFELCDLAALEHGGRVVETSDMFFGDAQHLLLPGRSTHMGDGWETRRRRGPGHDWAIVALGAAGTVRRIELDTEHFKGNAPGACVVEGAAGDPATGVAWRELLPRTPLEPHTRHVFEAELAPLGPLSHVRLSIFPDGGVARLRLWGRTPRAARGILALAGKNALATGPRADELRACCGSTRWATGLSAGFPFTDLGAVIAAGERLWRGLDRADWLEAFAAHPTIGDRSGSAWSKGEQAGAASADAAQRARLAELNQAYAARFGHIFIVCATGRSAGEIAALLERRLARSPELELATAAEEQRKITRLRLWKWLEGA